MVDPFNAIPSDIHLDDIVHPLSNICRFTGHTRDFYSVAQHSVHVAELVWRDSDKDVELTMAALVHDAHEAYLSDLSAPVRRNGCMHGYNLVCDRLQDVIHTAVGVAPLTVTDKAVIREADLAMLRMEMIQFLNATETELRTWGLWQDDSPYFEIEPMQPFEARDCFHEAFQLYIDGLL